MSGAVIVLILLIVSAVVLIGLYNRLVALRNRVANAFAQIDVQLKRRHDLIPNLVEIARRYMSHERDTLEAVVLARNNAVTAREAAAGDAGNAAKLGALSSAEHTLGGSLGRLFALSEGYPDLKANTSMAQLSEELVSTENRVAFARQAFNNAVQDLNTAVASFPAVLFSAALGFKPAVMLESIEAPQERAAPTLKF